MDQHQQQEQQIHSQTHSTLPGGGESDGIVSGAHAALVGQQCQHPGIVSTTAQPPHVLTGFGGAGPGMNAQVMVQLMTNPALAAAAAASPLFPPAAILANPSAFFTMPEYYRSQGALQNDQNARDSTAAISNAVSVQAQMLTTSQANQQQTLGVAIGNLSQLQNQIPQQQHNIFPLASAQHTSMPYGGVILPPTNQFDPSSVQAHIVACAAASQEIAEESNEYDEITGGASSCGGKGRRKKDLTPAERAKQNRERNREHAKSTRLRKKAYIQKLKELVEGLHAERTEEVRERRVAIQHLAEMQNVRRAVIRSFLRFHSNYERDKRKWETILEDSFWLKQPVTPYRCFRRSEIEQVRVTLVQRHSLHKNHITESIVSLLSFLCRLLNLTVTHHSFILCGTVGMQDIKRNRCRHCRCCKHCNNGRKCWITL
jgi:hypothetical protein